MRRGPPGLLGVGCDELCLGLMFVKGVWGGPPAIPVDRLQWLRFRCSPTFQ
jgi:hypothetical protein